MSHLRLIPLHRSLLLSLLLTACQAPQLSAPTPSSTPAPSSTPVSQPCPSATPVPGPVPTPPAFPVSAPRPDIQSMTEADVVRRQEQLRLYFASLSPGGSQLIYLIERDRRVRLKNDIGAGQKAFETWVFNRNTGQKNRLELMRQPFNIQLHWLNEQVLLLTEPVGIKSLALTRYDLTSGSQRVLLESALSISQNSVRDGWIYFTREAGKIEALQLDSGASKQWTLQGPLAGKIVQVETLPDGRLLLFDDHTPPRSADSGLCVGVEACKRPPSEVYLSVFDPATTLATAIPAFQGGDYLSGSLLASADGRHLAWADASGLILVDLATLTQQLQLDDAELLTWLANDQILLRYTDRLEVYDIAQNRSLGQIALGRDDQPVGYDTLTQQLLVKVRGNCGSGTQPVLKAWDLSSPSQPGPLRTLPDTTQSQYLGLTGSQAEQPQLLVRDRQGWQEALSFFRLRPQGQGLELLHELPYNANPDFSFAPAQTKESERWSQILYPLP